MTLSIFPQSADRLYCCWLGIALAAVVLMSRAPAQAQTAVPAWPAFPQPQDAQRFSVMPPAHINGQLTRTLGYFSAQPSQALAAWYQQAVPGQWVKNQVGTQTVLGQWIAPYFTTVQIQPSGRGSKVVVATTLQSPAAPKNAMSAEGERLPQNLPGSTRLLEHLSTADPGKNSSYYVLDAPAGSAAGIDSVSRWLSARGYRLHAQSQDKQGTHMLQFTGERREAVVIVGRRPDSSSYVLINDIRFTP